MRAALLPVAVLVSLAGGASDAAAQATDTATDPQLKFSGSVRARYEWIDGQPRAGFNSADDLLNFRTRLAAEYRATGWRFGAEIFDSRAHGSDAGTPLSTGEVNALELVQAYVQTDLADIWGEGSKSSLQVGRFMLNLGSRRLVAADDYRNTTNGYTGLRHDLTWTGGAEATVIYVLPQIRLPDDRDALRDNEIRTDTESFDLKLYGGVLTLPGLVGEGVVQPSYFRLEERDMARLSTRDRRLHTLSLRYFREPEPGRPDFDFEAAGQTGSVSQSSAPSSGRLDVRASYLRAEAGYTWAAPWKPRLALEYDRASGDKPGGDFGRFDTLFGMRRAEIAPSGLYNSVGRANLDSPGVRLELQPTRGMVVFFGWRGLWLAEERDSFSTTGVRDASGQSGDFAGHQVEARMRYWIVPERLRGELHLVLLDKGRFLREAPNANASRDAVYVAVDMTTHF